MTGRTRYGDLVGQAAAGVAAGQALLTGGPLRDRPEALRTIEAYRDLLQALSRHGQALLGGDHRIAGVRSSHPDDPREQIAAHLVDAVRRAAGRAPIPDATRRGGGPVAEAWAAAAVSLRAATDMLATHRSPDGGERSPFAALLDEPTVRVAGLGGLAHLIHTAAGAADGLGLRAGQAGLSWGQVRRFVPATKQVAALSARLLRLCSPTPGAADQLANLGLARPAVRTDTPVHELADRLARMHRGAWELARTRDVGVASLLDYAALGVILHGHTAAVLESHAPSGDGAGDPAARRPIAQLKRGGAVWQSMQLRLRELRTATPGSLALRADLQRVRQLLRDLVPLGPTAGVTAAGAVDRNVLATLAGGLRSSATSPAGTNTSWTASGRGASCTCRRPR